MSDIERYLDYVLEKKKEIENKSATGKILSFYDIYGYETDLTKKIEQIING